MDKANL